MLLLGYAIYGVNPTHKKTHKTVRMRLQRIVARNFQLTTNYKFVGDHLDIHNSDWTTITMPETHLLDLGITKNYYNYEFGVSINNLLDEDYEAPHGFNQNGRSLNLVFKRSF